MPKIIYNIQKRIISRQKNATKQRTNDLNIWNEIFMAGQICVCDTVSHRITQLTQCWSRLLTCAYGRRARIIVVCTNEH
jgi:hypothetical protein